MQEFESISASSYDPSALATKLTAKAAEGWSVVAIVPTGGDVTAFLTRDKGGSAESTKPAGTSAVDDDKDDADTPALVLPAKTGVGVGVGAEAAGDASAEESDDDDDKAEEKTEPVSEPSGWAIAPEKTTTTPEPTGVQPTLAATGAAAYQPAAEAAGVTTPATTTTPAAAPAAAAAAAAATPAAAPTPDPAPAAAPAVPAGWYADPAGRFELRYWDGSTWTEHVSRAGQQFTDPPVA
jgi:Protein of unknown function (DUF2510)